MILLSIQIRGALWTAALLIALTIAVHLVRLAVIGYQSTRAQERKEEPPAPPAPPQTVYYLVEKKRTRKKSREQLSDPKEITFK